MRVLAIIALLTLANCAVAATRLTASLTPAEATVGDRLTLEVRVEDAASRDVSVPLPALGDFVLIDVDSTGTTSESRLRFSLALYDTGEYELPALPVIVTRGVSAETLYTESFVVTIRSIVPDTASAIRPIKPFRDHPFRLSDVWRALTSSPWTWLGLAAAAALAGWLAWHKYFKRQSIPQPDPIVRRPAHEDAVRNLIALRDKKYPERGMLKEFYSEYTHIMREYLERRYEFPALETTTVDLERELANTRFPTDLAASLIPTFHQADLVKFAKYVPHPSECDVVLNTGFQLVDLTKPVESAPEAKAA